MKNRENLAKFYENLRESGGVACVTGGMARVTGGMVRVTGP